MQKTKSLGPFLEYFGAITLKMQYCDSFGYPRYIDKQRICREIYSQLYK